MRRKPHILCVDDRADSLAVRKLMLEKFGCEVKTAPDADSSLAALQTESIDLAIIDYHLGPGENGDNLAREIRRLYPKLRLVMLTGDPQLPESARLSVDAVLIKGAGRPSDMLDLIEELVPDAELNRPRPRQIPGGSVPRAS